MQSMLRVVKVENGFVRGLPAADPRITSFKGIPFAAPPVGENRWRAPQPAKDWDGVFDAYTFAPISMQSPIHHNESNIYGREWHVDPDTPMSEDCLYLNIWTPAHSPDEKLPVFVWYFGGGLQVGYTSEMEFDGERLARRGIVVVTVNYRLNVFGFLCHPEITAEAPEAPANFGHLDQQFATQWVKRNIAAFGGDPENITIGGQSAGGGSVLSQLTSPQNEGLVQRAIIQSGLFGRVYPGGRMPGYGRTLAEAEADGMQFFAFLGVSSLAEARQLDAFYIRDKALDYKGFWGTVVDDVFCMGDGFDLFVEGKHLQVSVLFGHTSDEFYSAPNVKDLDELKQMAVERFGDDAATYLALCEADAHDFEDVLKKATLHSLEFAIRTAVQASSNWKTQEPLYYYVFDAEIPGWDQPGAFHSVDLWFFFETLAKCWRPFVGKHYDLARQMCDYWANFIRSGDPNGKDMTGQDLPHWYPCTPDAPYAMVFDDEPKFVRQEPSPLMQFFVQEYFKQKQYIF
ncbi:carboxylic ester hydrolase [Alicyclobacillus hesperidum subsp. aegles]|nr:carboxylic ester hydrolase [Alicyclobacillus hesperidum subsp. aegles]